MNFAGVTLYVSQRLLRTKVKMINFFAWYAWTPHAYSELETMSCSIYLRSPGSGPRPMTTRLQIPVDWVSRIRCLWCQQRFTMRWIGIAVQFRCCGEWSRHLSGRYSSNHGDVLTSTRAFNRVRVMDPHAGISLKRVYFWRNVWYLTFPFGVSNKDI